MSVTTTQFAFPKTQDELPLPLEQLIALAIMQGLTEFLPISSSGHLNLLHLLTQWQDQGPLIDVSVHVGSLFAVVLYFWRDVKGLGCGFFDLCRGQLSQQGRLLLYLIVATIPVFIFGFILLKTGWIEDLRSLTVIAWTNIFFAIILGLSDRMGATNRDISSTTLRDGIFIGAIQALALIPGASRSGVTISMARFLGFNRVDAARVSMLLSIPTVMGLGAATAFELYGTGDLVLQNDALIAAGLSFVSAFLSIWFFMALLQRMTLMPFVAYRLIGGSALLAYIYW